MIEHLRPPSPFDRGPHRRYRSPRLPRDDHAADAQAGGVDGMFRGDLGHVQGVAGGAADGGRPAGSGHFQSPQRGDTAGGNHHAAAGGDGVVGAPKPDERAEGKRHQHAILGGDLGRVEHILPAAEPPLPIVERIEHDERPALRAGSLMKAGVSLQRPGAVGGQIVGLGRFEQIVFIGEGPVGEFVERFERPADACQLGGVEAVVRQDGVQQLVQPPQLMPRQIPRVHRLQAAAFVGGVGVHQGHHNGAGAGREGKAAGRSPSRGCQSPEERPSGSPSSTGRAHPGTDIPGSIFPAPAKRGGFRRRCLPEPQIRRRPPFRAIGAGMSYISNTGCPWVVARHAAACLY